MQRPGRGLFAPAVRSRSAETQSDVAKAQLFYHLLGCRGTSFRYVKDHFFSATEPL